MPNYTNGETVIIGDQVLCVKKLLPKIVKGEKVMVPLKGEVVPSGTFMQPPGDHICVVFHEDSFWSSHSWKSMNLPRKSGGFGFIKPQELRLQSRGVKGQSVFDALPKSERPRYYDERE